MPSQLETARVAALLRVASRPWTHYSEAIEADGSALALLEQEHGMLATELVDAELERVEGWLEKGFTPVSVLDEGYPANLRLVHDRPPLIFIAGTYEDRDRRSVAVVGSREATDEGLEAARALSRHLAQTGFTVVSGLARGIDVAAHREALACAARTVAVVGTGLAHAYPPEHEQLQREIASRFAVISQFWPEQPPTRQSFPMRNAVMSGLSLGTVIVEATHTSGTRIQARRALMHGRPVFIRDVLLSQQWAQELADRPGTYVYTAPRDVTDTIERLTATDALTV